MPLTRRSIAFLVATRAELKLHRRSICQRLLSSARHAALRPHQIVAAIILIAAVAMVQKSQAVVEVD